MNRKLIQFWAVILVVSAALLGGWAGFRSVLSTPEAVISGQSAATKVASGPVILFPQPVAQPEEDAPAQAVSAQRPISDTPSEVIPGGLVIGQALDRLWESNSILAWQVSAESLTAPNWFIAGVIKRGDQTQIIVQFDGEPTPRFFKIGDVLPGGGKLAWVRPDAIGVITPSQKKLGVPVLSGLSEQNTGFAVTSRAGQTTRQTGH